MTARSSTKDGTSRARGERQVTDPPRGDLFSPLCPTRRLLDRIGTKWVSMLVTVLGEAVDADADADAGEVRFAELQRRAPGISRKMLSQTLAALVADGLVERRVEATVPPAVHYRLSPLGQSLTEPLAMVRDWAETHMHEIDLHRRRLGSGA